MPGLLAFLGLNTTPFNRNLRQATRDAKRAGKEFAEAFGEFTGEKLGRLVGVAAVEEGFRNVLEYAEKIRALSERTGQGVEQIEKWDYAAQKAHTSVETLVTAFEKFQIAQAKAAGGSEKSIELLQRLGLSREQINNLQNAGKNFEIVGDRIKGAEINGQMLKDVTEAFGRSSREIIPVFKRGLAEAGDEIERMGGLMSPKMITAATEASERIKLAWYSVRPVIGEMVLWASKRFNEMADFLRLTIGVMLVDFKARRDFDKDRAPTFLGRSKENFAGQKDKQLGVEDYVAKARREYIEKVAREREEREKELVKMEAALSDPKSVPASVYAAVQDDALQEAKEVLRIKEQTAQIAMHTALSEMSAAERVLALQKGISVLKEEAAKVKDPKEKAEIELEEARLEEWLSRSEKELEHEKEKAKKAEGRYHYQAPEANERVRIGAFGPQGVALSAANASVRSEHHLARIEEHLSDLRKNQRRTKY